MSTAPPKRIFVVTPILIGENTPPHKIGAEISEGVMVINNFVAFLERLGDCLLTSKNVEVFRVGIRPKVIPSIRRLLLLNTYSLIFEITFIFSETIFLILVESIHVRGAGLTLRLLHLLVQPIVHNLVHLHFPVVVSLVEAGQFIRILEVEGLGFESRCVLFDDCLLADWRGLPALRLLDHVVGEVGVFQYLGG